MPSDGSGIQDIAPVIPTPDGQEYVYGYSRTLSDMYVVDERRSESRRSMTLSPALERITTRARRYPRLDAFHRNKLGPYEILAPIGAGGMGEVYRARDPRLDREVAIKVLPATFSQDPDRLRALRARGARRRGVLNHPNIPRSTTSGRTTASPYIATELLEGETLREPRWRAAGLARARRSTTRCRSPRASPRRTRRASSTGT